MTRKLQPHGNGVALVFDRKMLDALSLTADTPVEVTIRAGAMTVTPAHGSTAPDDNGAIGHPIGRNPELVARVRSLRGKFAGAGVSSDDLHRERRLDMEREAE